MLDFIYYPVSFILWCWHKVFGFVFGESTAVAWILGIIFLTFTVRGIMFKPFVNQVRSMKKMQDFAPEMKKIQKKYASDRQRQAQEMQKLQREHGVNPLGSCLPMLLQIPVFIGLNWVLRAFTIQPRLRGGIGQHLEVLGAAAVGEVSLQQGLLQRVLPLRAFQPGPMQQPMRVESVVDAAAPFLAEFEADGGAAFADRIA